MAERAGPNGREFTAVARTHTGRRANNEDLPVLVDGADVGRAGSLLFGVADGMGGYQAGEIAAEIVARTVVERFVAGDGEPADWLRAAHDAVAASAMANPAHSGMGAVATIALASGGTLRVGHVGDSRLYRCRAGAFEPLTEDQSATGVLVRAGRLTRDEVRAHPMNNIVLQAIGHPDHPPEPASASHDLLSGDVYLACSDGLSDVVPEARIGEIIARASSLDDAADRLVAEALADQPARDADGTPVRVSGGKDNITLVLVRIDREEDRPRRRWRR